MVIRCRTYAPKAKEYSVRSGSQKFDGLYDKSRVVFYDKGACKFVSLVGKGFSDEIKVSICATTVEYFCAYDEDEEVWYFSLIVFPIYILKRDRTLSCVKDLLFDIVF